MQRNETPIYIADLDKLDYLAEYENGLQIAKDRELSAYYLIVDHLALPISASLIDPQTGQFLDPISSLHSRKELLSYYNPFRPEDYNASATIVSTSYLTNLENPSDWVYRTRVNPLNTNSSEADWYVVHHQHRWLGINITKEFGLKIKYAGLTIP